MHGDVCATVTLHYLLCAHKRVAPGKGNEHAPSSTAHTDYTIGVLRAVQYVNGITDHPVRLYADEIKP